MYFESRIILLYVCFSIRIFFCVAMAVNFGLYFLEVFVVSVPVCPVIIMIGENDLRAALHISNTISDGLFDPSSQ